MAGRFTQTAVDSSRCAPVAPSQNHSRLRIGVCLAGILLLTALAAFSRAPLVYDEAPYLKPVALLRQYGLSLRFLRDYPEPAGLLHNVLHWALAPLTGLKPPAVRLVNPILLFLTIFVSFLTLRLLGSRYPLATSVTLIGIPAIWNLTGMVLTEMPAFFLLSLSTYLLLLSTRAAPGRRLLWSLLAASGGVLLGLAFLSRATAVVVLGAVPCLIMIDWKRAVAFAAGVLLVVGPVIAFWGGLVPPHSVVPVAPSSVSLYNLALSFCYGATMMVIIAPRWFDLPIRWTLPIIGATVVLNLVTGCVKITVLRTVLGRLPAVFQLVAPQAVGSIMLALAVLFVVCSLKHAYVRRHEPAWLFLCLAMLLLLAAPAKITHQFSSRYTGMASGMMVMASEPYVARVPWSLIGLVVGMLVGLSSLLSYYAQGTH